eukprot:3186492-Rhodomonas_salina.1
MHKSISLLRSFTTASHSSDSAQEHLVIHDRISLLRSLTTTFHSSDRSEPHLTAWIMHQSITPPIMHARISLL